jgi:hypothetical protein
VHVSGEGRYDSFVAASALGCDPFPKEFEDLVLGTRRATKRSIG